MTGYNRVRTGPFTFSTAPTSGSPTQLQDCLRRLEFLWPRRVPDSHGAILIPYDNTAAIRAVRHGSGTGLVERAAEGRYLPACQHVPYSHGVAVEGDKPLAVGAELHAIAI